MQIQTSTLKVIDIVDNGVITSFDQTSDDGKILIDVIDKFVKNVKENSPFEIKDPFFRPDETRQQHFGLKLRFKRISQVLKGPIAKGDTINVVFTPTSISANKKTYIVFEVIRATVIEKVNPSPLELADILLEEQNFQPFLSELADTLLSKNQIKE